MKYKNPENKKKNPTTNHSNAYEVKTKITKLILQTRGFFNHNNNVLCVVLQETRKKIKILIKNEIFQKKDS